MTCLINISNKEIETSITGFDIVKNKNFEGILQPYQVAWIK